MPGHRRDELNGLEHGCMHFFHGAAMPAADLSPGLHALLVLEDAAAQLPQAALQAVHGLLRSMCSLAQGIALQLGVHLAGAVALRPPAALHTAVLSQLSFSSFSMSDPMLPQQLVHRNG